MGEGGGTKYEIKKPDYSLELFGTGLVLLGIGIGLLCYSVYNHVNHKDNKLNISNHIIQNNLEDKFN